MKYHLGTCLENINRHTQKKVKIAVVANPSHLEGTYTIMADLCPPISCSGTMRYTLTDLVCVAVDPVVQGKTRAEQFYNGDESGRFITSVCIISFSQLT